MILIIQNILIASLIFHSIHISYGEATLTDNEFHGKITFYKDDFLLALKNWKRNSLRNLDSKEFDKLKLGYLRNHFIAFVNDNKKLSLILTGHSENDKSIWFEFKFISDEKINSMKLKYTVLIKEYNDQMNLLNISSSIGDESFIFNESKHELRIKT